MLVSGIQQSDSYTCICLPTKLFQLCPTVYSSMDCSLPGTSVLGILQARVLEWVAMPSSRGSSHIHCTVHGILQARVLEWVAFPFSRGSSQPRDRTQVSHIASGFFTSRATREDNIYIRFYFFFHCKLLQDIEYNFKCYTVGPCWLSTSYIVMCMC